MNRYLFLSSKFDNVYSYLAEDIGDAISKFHGASRLDKTEFLTVYGYYGVYQCADLINFECQGFLITVVENVIR